MPVTTYDIFTHELQRAPAQRVYLRRRWNTDWVWQPNLFCTMTRTGIAPNMALAQLHWLYGLVQHPTDDNPVEYPPLDILGWFVKIETDWISQFNTTVTHKHFGVITEEDRERRGAVRVTDGQTVGFAYSGQQNLVAMGLEYLFRRQRVDRSIVQKLDGSTKEVRRGLTFNDDNQIDRDRGNRTVGIIGGGHYAFTENLTTAEHWSTRKIVDYLHEHFRPLGSNEFDLMNWQLDWNYMDLLPDNDKPKIETHNRTLGEIFDELMNRRRGLGWAVFVQDDVGNVRGYPFVRPLSLAGTPVDMPDGWTLQPAKDQAYIYTDFAIQQNSPIIKRSLLSQYDQVRVVGERVRSVFTVSAADGTLVQDWTAAQRNDYNSAASGLGDYPTDAFEQEVANDLVRRRPDLARVFASFKLGSDLSYVRDGVGGTLAVWLPSYDNSTVPEPVYRPALRFLNYLPIDEHDVAGEAKQYMRPLVLVRVVDGDTDKYLPIDQLGTLARVEEYGDGNGFRWSAHVRMAEHDAALWIHTSGKPQHVLASHASDFVPLGDGSDDRDPPELDWRADLLATVCVEAQRNVEVVWPVTASITDRDSVRRLLIEVGEEGRLDYIAAGTVTGLEDDGKLVHQTGGVYLRDDRNKMLAIAKQAYVWYQRIRQAVEIPFSGYYPGIREGLYIIELGNAQNAEPIEAIVSQVEHDFVRGQSTVRTDYAEIDFRRIV